MSEKSPISNDEKSKIKSTEKKDTNTESNKKEDLDEKTNKKESDLNSNSEKLESIPTKKESKKGIKNLLTCGEESSDIKMIVLGLFALIGFIILVYSIFVAAVGEPLASVIDTVFVAALIGSFTLVGTILSHMYLKK
ncbi:MAG: hypothetical protein ACPKPY_04210 [Nitrososphaeraceae archaeon]